MSWAFIAGPAAALLGIGAVFWVMRRKAVDKRSMYSARRSQIEHKVRAARQRTLAPHGKAEKPEEAPAPSAGTSPFAAQAPGAVYEVSAYEPPPAAAAPVARGAPEAPSSSPWDVGTTVQPPGQFEAPPAPPPAFEPAPAEEVWTPAPAPPRPPEPVTPIEPIRPAAAAASPTGWSVVGEAKESAAVGEPEKKKKKKGKDQEAAPAGSWALASGNAPGTESDEGDELFKAPGQTVAIAQYAVLVVGLIAVLIGVLIMVAGPPVK
jgi:hypothetical protein